MLFLRACRFCFNTKGSISIVTEGRSEVVVGVGLGLSSRGTGEEAGGIAGVDFGFGFVLEHIGLGGSLGV